MMSKWREGEMIHLSWWAIQRWERVRLKGDGKKHKLCEAPSSVAGPPSSSTGNNGQVEGKGQRGESGAGFPVPFQF